MKDKKDEQRTKATSRKPVTNMVDANPTISVITLNAIVLNAAIKREILSKLIKKHDSTMCCL